MSQLSVCIIAKDEEKNIGICLDSVLGIADELIVVDTGSSDSTVKVAKEHGAKVWRHKWRDDFSEARNFALEKASGEWILQLDADEDLYPDDKGLLRQLLKNKSIDGYFCQIVNLANVDSTEGAIVHSFVRLFRHKLFRYRGIVHETPGAIKGSKPKIGWSNIRIMHWGYLDPKVRFTRLSRNTSLLEKAIQQSPQSPLLHLYKAKELVKSGRLREALKYFEQAESLGRSKAQGSKLEIVKATAECLWKLGYTDKALAEIEKARASFPDNPDVHFIAGMLHAEKKEWSKAAECFISCSKLPNHPRHKYLATEMGLDWRSRQRAGACLKELNRPDEAVKFFEESLKINPDDATSFSLLASIWLEKNKPGTVKKWLSSLVDWENPQIQAMWQELLDRMTKRISES